MNGMSEFQRSDFPNAWIRQAGWLDIAMIRISPHCDVRNGGFGKILK